MDPFLIEFRFSRNCNKIFFFTFLLNEMIPLHSRNFMSFFYYFLSLQVSDINCDVKSVAKNNNSETYVKYFASILPGAPKSLKSLRFSRQIVLCMHRTLASLLRISSSSGVWKFVESLNLLLVHKNFCRKSWIFMIYSNNFVQPTETKCFITVSKLPSLRKTCQAAFAAELRRVIKIFNVTVNKFAIIQKNMENT